jgi:hypothetical protein
MVVMITPCNFAVPKGKNKFPRFFESLSGYKINSKIKH